MAAPAARTPNGTYGDLLRRPATRRLAIAALAARLPQGMLVLALLLLVDRSASYAFAVTVVATVVLALGVSNPLRARLADRLGIARVVVRTYVGYVLALGGLVLAVRDGWPHAVVLVLAALTGGFAPPLGSAMRVLWREAADDRSRQAAIALDTALIDLGEVAGPPLAAVVAAVAGPAAAALALLALLGLAVAVVARSAAAHAPSRRASRSLVGPMADARVRAVVACALLVNAAVAAAEVGLAGWAIGRRHDWAAGLLLSGFAAGSITGGLVFGRFAGRTAPEQRLPVLLLALSGALAVLACATTTLPLLIAAGPLAGAALGPALTVLFGAAADAAPDGAATETQAWVITGMSAGWALAGATVGGIAQAHAGTAIAAAAGTALVAAGVARLAAGRRTPIPQAA